MPTPLNREALNTEFVSMARSYLTSKLPRDQRENMTAEVRDSINTQAAAIAPIAVTTIMNSETLQRQITSTYPNDPNSAARIAKRSQQRWRKHYCEMKP